MTIMNFNDRKQALIKLGILCRSDKWKSILGAVYQQNHWFTPENTSLAVKSWGCSLTIDNIEKWLNSYPHISKEREALNIQVIMAGNLPLVGLHDLISVFAGGHHLRAKLSSKDSILMPWFVDILMEEFPEISKLISFSDKLFDNPDAIIATGSDQTIKTMEARYSSISGIYRGNRHSIAVLNGTEDSNDADKLIIDMNSYFGLGCRNVCYIFIPSMKSLDLLIKRLEKNPHKADHPGYLNSLKQQKAVFKISNIPFIEAGNMLLKESQQLGSAMGVIHYGIYSDIDEIDTFIKNHRDEIQCIIAQKTSITGTVPFGGAQFPDLWDYADNKDTLSFLLNLNE